MIGDQALYRSSGLGPKGQSGRRAFHWRRRVMATDPGANGREYADMSNVKPGEIPGRRKPEVSRATSIAPGLAGT